MAVFLELIVFFLLDLERFEMKQFRDKLVKSKTFSLSIYREIHVMFAKIYKQKLDWKTVN